MDKVKELHDLAERIVRLAHDVKIEADYPQYPVRAERFDELAERLAAVRAAHLPSERRTLATDLSEDR